MFDSHSDGQWPVMGRLVWRHDGARRHVVGIEGDFEPWMDEAVGALLEALARTSPVRVVFDARELTLFGSWGLRAIERGARALHDAGAAFVVADPSEPVRAVMDLFEGDPRPQFVTITEEETT